MESSSCKSHQSALATNITSICLDTVAVHMQRKYSERMFGDRSVHKKVVEEMLLKFEETDAHPVSLVLSLTQVQG
jgi:hypothetical protein